jgi:indolepyruvate ferredoxin oxidoreductase beta subunit
MPVKPLVNVVFVGPGAAPASELLARAAFVAGHDVKQAELGAALASVRFGAEVLSPLVPRGEADFAVVLDAAEAEAARALLREGGALLGAEGGADAQLAALAARLDLPEEAWRAARAIVQGR